MNGSVCLRMDKAKKDKTSPDLSQKEKDLLKDMKVVQEFYARGFSFLPIDLYRSDAIKFQIVEDQLLPPFMAIDGMGGVAAQALANAAKDGPFLSKDDIRQRAKVSQSTLDTMAGLGILGNMPESNQLSVFDM